MNYMDQKLISELVYLVQQATPELFATALAQVTVLVLQKSITALVEAACAVLLLRLAYAGKRLLDMHPTSDMGWTMTVLGLVMGAIFAGVAVSNAMDLLGYLVNPDYYALQALLDLVK